jgi:hypothetical protein
MQGNLATVTKVVPQCAIQVCLYPYPHWIGNNDHCAESAGPLGTLLTRHCTVLGTVDSCS